MANENVRTIAWNKPFPISMETLDACCERHMEERYNTVFFAKALRDYISEMDVMLVFPNLFFQIYQHLSPNNCSEGKLEREETDQFKRFGWLARHPRQYKVRLSENGMNSALLCDLSREAHGVDMTVGVHGPEYVLDGMSFSAKSMTYSIFLDSNQKEIFNWIRENSKIIEL